jgi:hypothetical protein
VLAQGPPITSGLAGFYVGDSYNASANLWLDVSGLGNHAPATGPITRMPLGVNGEDYLRGNTSTNVALPFSFTGDTYTFFHVCRCGECNDAPPPLRCRPGAPETVLAIHSGACKTVFDIQVPWPLSSRGPLSPPRYPPTSTTWQRIWDMRSPGGFNYLSGFVQGISGVAYHQAQIGGATNLLSAWVLSVDQVCLCEWGGSSVCVCSAEPPCPLCRAVATAARLNPTTALPHRPHRLPARPTDHRLPLTVLQTFVYKANLVRSTGGIATTSPGEFTINLGNYGAGQKSDWDCAAALWYTRVLSATEYTAVEAWLNKVYCVVAFPPPPPSPPVTHCEPAWRRAAAADHPPGAPCAACGAEHPSGGCSNNQPAGAGTCVPSSSELLLRPCVH